MNNKVLKVLLSPEVKSGKIRLAKYWICPCGLASDSVYASIDNQIALRQSHPVNTIYLCPIKKNPQPSYEKAWFYNDCIAYEHEIPAIVHPTATELRRFGHRYLYIGSTKPRTGSILHIGRENDGTEETFTTKPIYHYSMIKTFFVDQILMILEESRELRHGPLSYILFKTYDKKELINLPYTEQYSSVKKEICLYSAALRQSDFLSEFLGFYRVIESVTCSNGKDWIANAINRVLKYPFLPIIICNSGPPTTEKNLIGIYKRRASYRLRYLRKKYNTNEEVARYLYNINRCGIAHGKDDVIGSDLGPSYFKIARDTILLKLLARMAIEDKRKA